MQEKHKHTRYLNHLIFQQKCWRLALFKGYSSV